MFFKTTEHMQRFLSTLEGLNKIRDRILDNEYSAAVYILTADNEIWSKSQPYIDREGIDLTLMLQEGYFSAGYKILISLAGNLFNGRTEPVISPLDLIRLDEDNFKVAVTALELRRYKTHADDISISGRPQTKERARIIELRRQGMTKEAIARELNVSLATVNRHTKGL